jgi:hypothetical protein
MAKVGKARKEKKKKEAIGDLKKAFKQRLKEKKKKPKIKFTPRLRTMIFILKDRPLLFFKREIEKIERAFDV